MSTATETRPAQPPALPYTPEERERLTAAITAYNARPDVAPVEPQGEPSIKVTLYLDSFSGNDGFITQNELPLKLTARQYDGLLDQLSAGIGVFIYRPDPSVGFCAELTEQVIPIAKIVRVRRTVTQSLLQLPPRRPVDNDAARAEVPDALPF